MSIKLRISDFGFRIDRRAGRLASSALRTPHSALRNLTAARRTFGNWQLAIENGFSLVELLVVMTLLSLIVLALMAVFSSTQQAFRASVTQTDVLETSRATVELIATDLRTLTPSGGPTNYIYSGNYPVTPVNFAVLDNATANCSYSGSTLLYYPLGQSLPGSALSRTNVLNYFFLLGRQNTKWTAVGYVVNASNNSPLYPLYRYYAETNLAASPYLLFSNFVYAINHSQWTNLSHVMDGVVHLTVRPFDLGGYRMTNTAYYVQYVGPNNPNNIVNYHDNVWFASVPLSDEVGCFFYSNAVPASVELQMGVLEDRALARASSLPFQSTAQLNYLAGQSGKVHLFRQRVTIPNVDPAAYQ